MSGFGADSLSNGFEGHSFIQMAGAPQARSGYGERNVRRRTGARRGA
ncbi:MAG: hypothetical protein ACREM2_11380 [Vulcanimicrobiaceae bacterium]